MKNTLRYIFAIPIGAILSIILPMWFIFLLESFMVFDFIIHFIDDYLINVFTGWLAVGFTIIIVPKKKKLFGIIQIVLSFIGAIYLYKINNEFNYRFFIGAFLGLFYFNLEERIYNPFIGIWASYQLGRHRLTTEFTSDFKFYYSEGSQEGTYTLNGNDATIDLNTTNKSTATVVDETHILFMGVIWTKQ
tara:strand:+ start:8736 stop:9305 length:570 start_codon:yes stop_codon:yes gene_type:complete